MTKRMELAFYIFHRLFWKAPQKRESPEVAVCCQARPCGIENLPATNRNILWGGLVGGSGGQGGRATASTSLSKGWLKDGRKVGETGAPGPLIQPAPR